MVPTKWTRRRRGRWERWWFQRLRFGLFFFFLRGGATVGGTCGWLIGTWDEEEGEGRGKECLVGRVGGGQE